MANSVTTQILLDGPKNVNIKIEGVLDTSNVAYTALINPATLQGMDWTGAIKAQHLKIMRISYSIQDVLGVILWWDATTPVRIESLEGRGDMKFRHVGGLVNNSAGGGTYPGGIGISTELWAALCAFSVIIECVKTGT